MKLIELNNDALLFNWDQLPETINANIQLRDKIFQEVKTKFPLTRFIDNRTVAEMNKYALARIKIELGK